MMCIYIYIYYTSIIIYPITTATALPSKGSPGGFNAYSVWEDYGNGGPISQEVPFLVVERMIGG